METKGKIRHIEVTENSLRYCSRIACCSTTHLRPACCLDTSEIITWVMFFLLIFNHALPKIQSQSGIVYFKVEADWLIYAAPQTLFASRYPFRHTIPTPFLL